MHSSDKFVILGCTSAAIGFVLLYLACYFVILKIHWLNALGFTQYRGWLQGLGYALTILLSSIVILLLRLFDLVKITPSRRLLLLSLAGMILVVYFSARNGFKSGILLPIQLTVLYILFVARARTLGDVLLVIPTALFCTESYEFVLVAKGFVKLFNSYPLIAVQEWLLFTAYFLSELRGVKNRKLFVLGLVMLVVSNLLFVLFQGLLYKTFPFNWLVGIFQRAAPLVLIASLDLGTRRASSVYLMACYVVGIYALMYTKRIRYAAHSWVAKIWNKLRL